MEALDTTILNTAVPTLAAAFRVAPLSLRSVLSSYTLSLAVFIPASGWAADRFGTRRVFAAAIAVFSLGSLLCGLSTDIRALVFFRIVQGLGGALMVPVGRLTVVRTFSKSQLVRAMAFVAMFIIGGLFAWFILVPPALQFLVGVVVLIGAGVQALGPRSGARHGPAPRSSS